MTCGLFEATLPARAMHERSSIKWSIVFERSSMDGRSCQLSTCGARFATRAKRMRPRSSRDKTCGDAVSCVTTRWLKRLLMSPSSGCRAGNGAPPTDERLEVLRRKTATLIGIHTLQRLDVLVA